MKKAIMVILIFLFFGISLINAQEALTTNVRPEITIPKITNPPKLDGLLDDACWTEATKITGFYKYFPVDGEPASEKTEVFLAYDRKNLYVAFRCFESEKEKLRAYVSKRDTTIWEDKVGVVLDTFNSQRKAYGLICNALGVQLDWFFVEGETFDFGLDLIFHSEGKLTSDGYNVEYAIPFKSLRFPPGDVQTIGLFLYRVLGKQREWVFWPPRSKSKNTLLDQSSQITNIEGIEYSRNIELLPTFTALQVGELNEKGEFENSSPDSDFGFGLKYGITPNITVDFTYNPDFSQVEADVSQVDINQRYELYYDEKRPFFLEGADIFKTDVEAFYSRRIIDPLYGAKITGKVGNATFGFLSALDEGPGKALGDKDNPYLGEKALFNIFRGTYDLFGNSYIGFLMTSRDFAESSNKVVGIDGLFNFKQKYKASFQSLESYSTAMDGKKFNAPAFKVDFSRESRHLNYSFTYRDLYPDFQAEAGFIKRTDIREGLMKLGYKFIPNNKWIIDYTPSYEFSRMYDHNATIVEQKNKVSLDIQFPRNTLLTLSSEKGMERWVDLDFDKNMFALTLETAPNRYFSGKFSLNQGDSIFYDNESPYLGYLRFFQSQASIYPNAHLKEKLIFTKSTFWREKGRKEIYDYNIIRSKTTYHFNKKFSLRTILEYNAYWKELSADILLSYMHNYGTVFFLGYGSLFDRDEYMHLRQNHRSFFIKVSYLWRL